MARTLIRLLLLVPESDDLIGSADQHKSVAMCDTKLLLRSLHQDRRVVYEIDAMRVLSNDASQILHDRMLLKMMTDAEHS